MLLGLPGLAPDGSTLSVDQAAFPLRGMGRNRQASARPAAPPGYSPEGRFSHRDRPSGIRRSWCDPHVGIRLLGRLVRLPSTGWLVGEARAEPLAHPARRWIAVTLKCNFDPDEVRKPTEGGYPLRSGSGPRAGRWTGVLFWVPSEDGFCGSLDSFAERDLCVVVSSALWPACSTSRRS